MGVPAANAIGACTIDKPTKRVAVAYRRRRLGVATRIAPGLCTLDPSVTGLTTTKSSS
jgi:hypothetical protein